MNTPMPRWYRFLNWFRMLPGVYQLWDLALIPVQRRRNARIDWSEIPMIKTPDTITLEEVEEVRRQWGERYGDYMGRTYSGIPGVEPGHIPTTRD